MFSVHSTSKFSGFLPIRKPKNICSNKILWSMQEEFNFANQNHDKSLKIFSNISYARYLESFSSGLITFIFGSCNSYRRNFVLSDYKYRFTIEFGVERHFGSIDGKVISKHDTSHISRELVEDILKKYIGKNSQIRITNYDSTDPILASSLPLTQSQSIYKSMKHVHNKPIPPPLSQKYPKLQISRDVECYYINLLSCDRYFATFELFCQGAFSPRRFTLDFADFLGTKASMVELERLQEGIMHLNDMRVLDLYQTQYDIYKKRASSLRSQYLHYLDQFNHHFLKDS